MMSRQKHGRVGGDYVILPRHVRTSGNGYSNLFLNVMLPPMQYEELKRRLLSIIKKEEDRLRIYRLTEPSEKHVEVYGLDGTVDFEGPLLV